MIKEAYCSFEVAKLLKEKGFDEVCDLYYPKEGGDIEGLSLDELNYLYNNFIKAPTHQLAMAWLREKGFHIYTFHIKLWNFEIQNLNEDWTYSKTGYKSHEDAIEAACIYVLTNLI